jgi:flagellin-like hook-associated protein FlgL
VIKFGANILSQTVQRNLGRATLDLSTTSERLASGQRVNKASDDAAGLAIAASLNVNARIFTQGVRNLNDGLSAVNIAEGAMNELGNIIVRVEELATQSISETYSDTQRQALQKEATALTAEWNRIVEATSFNGQNLLTGASTRTVLQGGKGTEGTLAVQVGKAQAANEEEGFAGGTIRSDSDSSGNVAVGSNSFGRAISADGRFILFNSNSSSLVPGDTNGLDDVFLKDTVTGNIARVSTDSQGNQALGGSSTATGISADGRYALFYSTATNLVVGDTNGQNDAFVKDLLTGETKRVNTDVNGNQAIGGSSNGNTISADGRFVAFWSQATNLVTGDTNGFIDVFVKNIVTGDIVRVNTDSFGNQAVGGISDIRTISADGRYVAFTSDATNLVTGDTNGVGDAFFKDLVTGITTRVSTDSNGSQAIGGASEVRALSADGRYVVFDSLATNLVAGDTNGVKDVFIKDTTTGATTRINTTASNEQGTGAASYGTSISADGRYIGFWSGATNLVAGDTNGLFDAFLKDTSNGTTIRLNANNVTGHIASPYLTPDARSVVFSDLSNGGVYLRDLTKTGVQTLSGVVVSNKASAKVTLDLAQRYRAELLDYRSKLGATTSRISTFVNTLQSSTINYKAASSRITDADIAEEAAKSIASGIRQQVASSLLGQANQAPQISLQLLRNA